MGEDTGKLVDFVIAKVDAKKYYDSEFPSIRWPGTSEARVPCVFHEDHNTPSLHFNPKTGAWFCHGCDAKGNSVVSFHAERYGMGRKEAAEQIYNKFIRPVIDEQIVNNHHRTLLNTPTVMKYLVEKRFISTKIIKQYKLGWNGYRIQIPIRDEFGLCINMKGYDPWSKQHTTPKMINYKDPKDESKTYADVTMLFPLQTMSEAKVRSYVIIGEGEFDTLALLSLDLPAVTTTNGSKSWPSQYNEEFRGLKVFIAYDNDLAGVEFSQKVVCNQLNKLVKSIRRINIPHHVGNRKTKDVTDWMTHDPTMRSKAAWLEKIKTSELLIINKPETFEVKEASSVSLDQASKAEWFNRPIKVPAMITGKDTAPYMLPKRYRVSCNHSCDECPLADKGKQFKDGKIETNEPEVLMMIDSSKSQIDRILFNKAGLPAKPGCKAQCNVLETFTVEQVLMIPTVDSIAASSQYVMRSGYYVGHGLHPNRAYEFSGLTLPDPKDQHTTHLFHDAKPVQDQVESFHLDKNLKQALKIFQVRGKLSLLGHLMSIAEWQSRIITKIRERPDLHLAVDLVFHSAAAFTFNGEFVKRGMLDVLIIGDTRCGKGYVAEGLIRYYGLGEIASGENCSFAGLIGGIQTIGKRFFITWGIIPLNHNRLVCIDEASSISETEIGRMSRVRSEGIAEINKIKRESTVANTRLIWLSNPRSGRPMSSYNEGVQTIKELIGANEDISRFDFALTVATKEVPSEIINAPVDYDTSDYNKYPRDLLRALILWCWSRRADQIKFTEEATKKIIEQAIAFGHTYSSSIPLVQAENIRVKLAKVSVAVAGRVFSTDESGENLIVLEEHVKTACEILRMAYAKASMGYDTYSQRILATSTFVNKDPVAVLFEKLGEDQVHTMDGLLHLTRLAPDTLGDYMGDIQIARSFISDLVRHGCITQMELGRYYIKNPEFSAWLKIARNKLNGHAYLHLKGKSHDSKANRKS